MKLLVWLGLIYWINWVMFFRDDGTDTPHNQRLRAYKIAKEFQRLGLTGTVEDSTGVVES